MKIYHFVLLVLLKTATAKLYKQVKLPITPIILSTSQTNYGSIGSSIECASICAMPSNKCSAYVFEKALKTCSIPKTNDLLKYDVTDVQYKVAMIDMGKKLILVTKKS